MNEDRLVKLATLFINSGNQDLFEDTIVSIAKSKSIPTNKKLWSRAKAAAKKKFKIWPSAYGSAWASRWYKEHGGSWKKGSSKSNKAEDAADSEHNMSQSAMEKIEEDSKFLLENMSDMKESRVPEWVESLIAQVATDMTHVIDYMKYRNQAKDKMYIGHLAKINQSADILKDVLKVLSEEQVEEWVEFLITEMVTDLGHVADYMRYGHQHKKASKLFDPGFYFQNKWADYISEDFFFEKVAVYGDSGLGRWFKEKWVNIAKKDKSGKYAPCGRSKSKPGSYPKCRPSKRVSKETPQTTKEMTAKEKKSAISQKRRKQRKRKSSKSGQKPIRDSHSKRD